MCVTRVTYEACGHTEEVWKQCKRQKDRSRAAHRKKSGFLRSIFTTAPILDCDLPPGRRQIMDQKCAECKEWDKELAAKDRKERDRQMKAREAAQFRAENEEFHERRRLETKWIWTCGRCAEERRRPERVIREANGGACCARGVDEFEDWERSQGYLPKTSKTSHRPHRSHHRTNTSRATAPIQEEKVPSLGHTTILEPARREADATVRNYGWAGSQLSQAKSDVARAYVAMPGIDLRELSAPTSPPEPQPIYEVLGIDLERWGQSIRTAHGSYPPPRPPPDRPLPLRPLVRKSTGVQPPVARPVETHQTFSIPRKPLSAPSPGPATSVVRPNRYRWMGPTRWVDIPQLPLDINGVSPLSSPVRSRSRSPSPVLSMSGPDLRSARSTVSSLIHQIDSTIEHYQLAPVLKAPLREPRFREYLEH